MTMKEVGLKIREIRMTMPDEYNAFNFLIKRIADNAIEKRLDPSLDDKESRFELGRYVAMRQLIDEINASMKEAEREEVYD